MEVNIIYFLNTLKFILPSQQAFCGKNKREVKMTKPIDQEITDLHAELQEEIKRANDQATKIEKHPDKVRSLANEFFLNRKKYKAIMSRLRELYNSFDRINIAEYAISNESIEWYGELLNNEYNEVFKNEERYEVWLESEEVKKQAKKQGGVTVPPELYGKMFEDVGDRLFDIHRRIKAGKNYFDLYPPIVTQEVKIPHHVKKLFAESRLCFVYQNYCAAVSLSRAIMELAIKDKFGYDKNESIGSTSKYLDEAFNKKLISSEVHKISKDVILKANKVMHSGKMVKQKQALDVVEKTKGFLENMYS